jgi:LysM repeat protein
LSSSTIGIKIADGSYFPVLEQGFTGRKRLTLTTVKDNQQKVQIDMYSGDGPALAQARYVGSLIIENIPPARQGDPEIELDIGIDEAGQLSAEAHDDTTGETQDFSTSLATLPDEETYGAPDFEVDTGQMEPVSLEEPALTGESYPVGDEDRRKEHRRRKGPNLLLLVLFVLIGVALVAAVAYFVYRSIQGPQIPPLSTTTAPVQTAPAATEPAAPAEQPAAKPAAPDAAAAPAEAQPTAGVRYRIKKGDTLWDISATYYRNPWLYPKLAKANSIKNPDLIFAGTNIQIPPN